MPRRLALAAVTVASTIAGASLGSVTLLSSPVLYAAQTSFLVSALPPPEGESTDIENRAWLSLNRVDTYAQMLLSDQALQPVIDDVGLDATVEQLARTIEVEIPYETSVLQVKVLNRDPELAEDIAESLTQSAPPVLTMLDREDVEAPARTAVAPLGSPTVRAETTNLTRWLGPVTGGVTGMILGGGTAWELRRRRQLRALPADLSTHLPALPLLDTFRPNGIEPPMLALAKLRSLEPVTTAPIIVTGGTQSADSLPLTNCMRNYLGTSSILDLTAGGRGLSAFLEARDDAARSGKQLIVCAPPLPSWRNASEILRHSAGVLLVLPARGGLVADLSRSIQVLLALDAPLVGTVLTKDP